MALALDLRLRYLIGTDNVKKLKGYITECGYDSSIGDIAYCNLFDEKNTGKYGPYLYNSDTASEYSEGQIDASGPGWTKNLLEQFERRKKQGFKYIELDNPDAYSIDDILGAITLANTYGLQVVAKNPGLLEEVSDQREYVKRCVGIIVEKDAGTPDEMDSIRHGDIPVWFVSFGNGLAWAKSLLQDTERYNNMWVSYSRQGEYGSSEEISS